MASRIYFYFLVNTAGFREGPFCFSLTFVYEALEELDLDVFLGPAFYFLSFVLKKLKERSI